MFDEFFDQGDLELEKELPISFLCDRTKHNVAGAQPGFVNFVTLPFFNSMLPVVPALSENIEVLKANCEKWKDYTETEEDL